MVHVVVSDHSQFFPLADSFEGLLLSIVPEIKYHVAQQTYDVQESVLNNLVNGIGMFEECYVESHTLTTIEWGELLAAKCGARHLAYPLAESRVKKYPFLPGRRIFSEKLEKEEFYGCSSTSLRMIFGRDDVPSNYVNIGYDENELEETCMPLIQYKKKEGDYIITTVTRLDKTYIEWLTDASADIAKKYPEQNFVLIIAGGSPKTDREVFLKSNYNNVNYGLKNLDIRYLGYIDKLGKDLFRMSDLFVGMGTASINAISQRCITINIDPRNGMQEASGFFGVDTNNFAYSEKGKVYSIVGKIEEAYLFTDDQKERVKNAGRRLYEDEFEMNACFRKMDEIINSFDVVSDRESLRIPNYYRSIVRGLFEIKSLMKR